MTAVVQQIMLELTYPKDLWNSLVLSLVPATAKTLSPQPKVANEVAIEMYVGSTTGALGQLNGSSY